MQDTTKIKIGDIINAVFAWTENETPSDKNFFTGRVKNIVRRPSGAVYFELEKLDRLVPEDRVFVG